MSSTATSSVSLGTISDAHDVLWSLKDQVVDVKTAARILKIVKGLRPHAERLSKERNDVISQHGEKVPDKEGQYTLKGEEIIKIVTDQIKKIRDEMISIDAGLRIHANDLDEFKVSMEKLELLEPIIQSD